jgi:large subunit ribosomal protein L13
MKTFSATPADIDKKWILIDAEGVVLGRLASIVAMRLRGKHKPSFTPHMDMGDNVIVINADKVQMTGDKRNEPNYWHTGYPGRHQVAHHRPDPGRRPSRARGRCRRSSACCRATAVAQQMTNLRVYAGAEHPHEAQQPEVLDVKSMNKKNTRSVTMAETIKSLDDLKGRGATPVREAPTSPRSPSATRWAAPTPPASARTRSPASGSSPAPARSR